MIKLLLIQPPSFDKMINIEILLRSGFWVGTDPEYLSQFDAVLILPMGIQHDQLVQDCNFKYNIPVFGELDLCVKHFNE